MGIAITLKQYLASHEIDYSECAHDHTDTALQSASATDVASDHVVKAVLLSDGEEYLLAALPANRRLALDRLSDYLRQDYELASEEDIAEVFSDCDVGAIPPVGDAYGIKAIWDDALCKPDGVYLEAGDHETLLRLKKEDFMRLMADAQHATISQ